MKETTRKLLEIVSDWFETPNGAYNIREDGERAGRQSTEGVQIESKTDKPGIDITVRPHLKGETVYIPACVTHSDVDDLVYNDFYIGEVGGRDDRRGLRSSLGREESARHNGIHRFFLQKGARVLYLEKHIGTGQGTGQRIINPQTYAELSEDSYMEMDTTQIKGVDSTNRQTKAILQAGAKIVIKEKIMTDGAQAALTDFEVELNGEDSGAHLVSRSIAKGFSKQVFRSKMLGNTRCTGHSECDAIIMDSAQVSAIPELTAGNVDAALIHEAAIGKIAGEQLIKLMTLGLSEREAEEKIIEGFLK